MNNDWIDDYLMHSGRKGMQWGVRLFQNPDGSLTPLGRLRYLKGGREASADGFTNKGRKRYLEEHPTRGDYTLKRGTQFQRISTEKNEAKSGRIKWATYDKDDNDIYYNFTPTRKKKERYAHTLEAKKDLKVASSDTYYKTMMDVIGNKTITNLIRENKAYDSLAWVSSGSFLEHYGNKTVKEARNDIYNHNRRTRDLKAAYKYGLENKFKLDMANYDSSPYAQEFVKLLKDKGYDAIEDEFSRTMDGTKHAVILLDPDIATKKIKTKRLQDNWYYEPPEDD